MAIEKSATVLICLLCLMNFGQATKLRKNIASRTFDNIIELIEQKRQENLETTEKAKDDIEAIVKPLKLIQNQFLKHDNDIDNYNDGSLESILKDNQINTEQEFEQEQEVDKEQDLYIHSKPDMSHHVHHYNMENVCTGCGAHYVPDLVEDENNADVGVLVKEQTEDIVKENDDLVDVIPEVQQEQNQDAIPTFDSDPINKQDNVIEEQQQEIIEQQSENIAPSEIIEEVVQNEIVEDVVDQISTNIDEPIVEVNEDVVQNEIVQDVVQNEIVEDVVDQISTNINEPVEVNEVPEIHEIPENHIHFYQNGKCHHCGLSYEAIHEHDHDHDEPIVVQQEQEQPIVEQQGFLPQEQDQPELEEDLNMDAEIKDILNAQQEIEDLMDTGDLQIDDDLQVVEKLEVSEIPVQTDAKNIHSHPANIEHPYPPAQKH